MSNINANFTVPAPAGITVTVKKIGSGVHEDPVASAMSEIMNPPMPRMGMRQAPLSGKQSPSAPTKGYQDDNR